MASQLDLDYNQFRSALDSVAGEGVNEWSSPNSGALKLKLANGKTWTPSGASSGVGYIPPKPAGAYTTASETYNEDGTKNINTGLLPPGHYSEVDQSWHLDNPPPPTNQYTGDPDFVPADTSKIYLGREPDYRAAEPEKYLISGDISTLLGQEGSNQHMNVEYVRQGDKLVPTSAPKMWEWQKSNELETIAKFALAVAAPQFMGPLASALGVSNATAAAIFNAGVNVASGQDPIDAIKNAAISYGVGIAGSEIAGQMASQGIDKALANAIGSTGGNVLGAIVKGGDPLQALISGGIGAGVGALTSEIPGFSDLSNGVQQSIRTAMGSVLQGKDPTQGLINSAISAGLKEATKATTNNVNTKSVVANDNSSAITKTQGEDSAQIQQAVAPPPAQTVDDFKSLLQPEATSAPVSASSVAALPVFGGLEKAEANDAVNPLPISQDLSTKNQPAPAGGLNIASANNNNTIAGFKSSDLVKPLITGLGSVISSKLFSNRQLTPNVTSKPIGGLTAAKAPVNIAPQVDVSKLIPIQKAVVPPKTLPSNAKLAPVQNIANLTSLMQKVG